MNFTILKMWQPNNSRAQIEAIERLISFGNQSFDDAENIVDVLRTGI